MVNSVLVVLGVFIEYGTFNVEQVCLPKFKGRDSTRVVIRSWLNYSWASLEMNWGMIEVPAGTAKLSNGHLVRSLINEGRRTWGENEILLEPGYRLQHGASKSRICAVILTKRFRLGKNGKTTAFLNKKQLNSALLFVDYPA
jgi:hypothetical protein